MCKFVLKCTPHEDDKEISYADQMIKDQVVKGLSDLDIQQDIMAHEKQDMSLEEALKLIEAKEEGKRSQTRLTKEAAAMMNTTKGQGEVRSNQLRNPQARAPSAGIRRIGTGQETAETTDAGNVKGRDTLRRIVE